MSASCQHLIWTIHFVIALMKRQAACSCSTFFFFWGICVCVRELSMGKGLSVTECHSLTARYMGSCRFVPWTEWELCSVDGRLNVPGSVQLFLLFLLFGCASIATWEPYFAARCPFKRDFVCQAVIGAVGVQDSCPWGQEAHAMPWLLQASSARGWGIRGASAHSAQSAFGIVWLVSTQSCLSYPRWASPSHDIPSSQCAILVEVVYV